MLCGTAAGRCTLGVGGAQAAAENSTPATKTNTMLVVGGIICPPHPSSNPTRPHDCSCKRMFEPLHGFLQNTRNRHARTHALRRRRIEQNCSTTDQWRSSTADIFRSSRPMGWRECPQPGHRFHRITALCLHFWRRRTRISTASGLLLSYSRKVRVNPGVLSPHSNAAEEGGSYEGNRIFRSRL